MSSALIEPPTKTRSTTDTIHAVILLGYPAHVSGVASRIPSHLPRCALIDLSRVQRDRVSKMIEEKKRTAVEEGVDAVIITSLHPSPGSLQETSAAFGRRISIFDLQTDISSFSTWNALTPTEAKRMSQAVNEHRETMGTLFKFISHRYPTRLTTIHGTRREDWQALTIAGKTLENMGRKPIPFS